MRVTVSVGPGPYSDDLLAALRRDEETSLRVVRSWPQFLVEEWPSGSDLPQVLMRSPAYSRIERLIWAGWRRIPWAGRFETPRAILCGLADRLARRYVEECDLFVGWARVSLQSLRRARERGSLTLLEHPMSHVSTWMRLVGREYEKWGTGAKSRYSLLPRALVHRMQAEYEVADFICVPSTFARKSFLDAGVPDDKLIQIPFGVDPDVFRPASTAGRSGSPSHGRETDSPSCGACGPVRNGRFRILYVGRLELLKGVPYLLQAFAELALPDAELWLAGRVLPEIEPLLKRYADERVHVTGSLSREELSELYRQAEMFAFPTVNDGYGLVLLEAMASGLPVVATEHSGGPDAIEDGSEGFVIPAGDVEQLKGRIEWLYRHREQAREMGRQARQRVLEGLTLEDYGRRLRETYRQLAERNRVPL